MPSTAMLSSSDLFFHRDIASPKLRREEFAEQRCCVRRLRIIVRKSAVTAAPGVAQPGDSNTPRDDAAVHAVIVGSHRAAVRKSRDLAGIGVGQAVAARREAAV